MYSTYVAYMLSLGFQINTMISEFSAVLRVNICRVYIMQTVCIYQALTWYIQGYNNIIMPEQHEQLYKQSFIILWKRR